MNLNLVMVAMHALLLNPPVHINLGDGDQPSSSMDSGSAAAARAGAGTSTAHAGAQAALVAHGGSALGAPVAAGAATSHSTDEGGGNHEVSDNALMGPDVGSSSGFEGAGGNLCNNQNPINTFNAA